MRSFFAISMLTIRNAFRSHLFLLLLGVLLLCVAVIPNVVSAGLGSASEYIRISLLYSSSAVATVLALSSVWLGCYAMNHDIENYQLHMVVSKPVSRPKIWLAKWFGVAMLHVVLLFVAGTVIYATILAQFYRRDFSAADRQRVENEVLVGRRVFLPTRPDVDFIVRETLRNKREQLEKDGKNVDTSPQAQEKQLSDTRKEVLAAMSSAKPGGDFPLIYAGLDPDLKEPLYLRYRLYINKVATEGQRETHGLWRLGIPRVEKQTTGNIFEQAKTGGYSVQYFPLSQLPESIRSGEFHEKKLNPEWKMVSPDGKVGLLYTNFDRQNGTQYFQPKDGPKLLMRVTGFAANYYRGLVVIALELMILAGLGCAAGGILTLPTALFVVISYLLFGSFASFMAGTSYFGNAADYIGYYVGKALLLVVIPVQEFGVTELLADGELIEFGYIGKLFYAYLLFRALPLFVFGILLYRRRELGLVVRK